MRILTALGLAAVLSVSVVSASAKAQVVETQKQNGESNTITIEDKITSPSDNFIVSVYIPEINSKKLAYFEQWRKKAKSIDYSKLPKGDFIINASAYTAAADECGKSDGITASGRKVTEKRTLACPPAYQFGTKIEIYGMGTYICEDRGGAIKGNRFDIYMKTKKQAFAFGRRNLVARVVK